MSQIPGELKAAVNWFVSRESTLSNPRKPLTNRDKAYFEVLLSQFEHLDKTELHSLPIRVQVKLVKNSTMDVQLLASRIDERLAQGLIEQRVGKLELQEICLSKVCDWSNDQSSLILRGERTSDFGPLTEALDSLSLHQRESVRTLDLSCCPAISSLEKILSLFPNVQTLQVSGATRLPTLKGLQVLSGSLHTLKGENLLSLTDLDGLADCTELKELSITHANRLADFSPIAGASGLKKLELDGCYRAAKPYAKLAETLASLGHLESLSLRKIPEFTRVDWITPCSGLLEVDVSGTGVSEIEPLLSLPKLNAQAITSDDCPNL